MTCDACTCGDKSDPAKTCAWTLAPNTVDDDYWATDCGLRYLFFEGGPKANKFAFCPFCGLPLVEVVPPPEPEEDDDGD